MSRSEKRDPVAFFGALCMFLSTVEYLIPKPVPFLRVGIANLPLLMGLPILTPGQLFLVAFLKVLGQALVGGTLFSYVFLFSAFGTFTGLAAMLAVYSAAGKISSAVGISVIGALASNLAQIVLARLLILGSGAWLIAPPFLAIGTVTSVLLGLFSEAFQKRSKWYAAMKRGGVT
jgi:heptaprenyl diphosphate synthase